MQQTEHYKLNLIETGDPLSPAPLNENADKVEAALLTKTDLTDTAALEQRITTLELHKIAVGTYTGDGGISTPQFINVGFTPRAVLTQRANAMCAIIFDKYLDSVALVEGGFTVAAITNVSFNSKGEKYKFAAFA